MTRAHRTVTFACVLWAVLNVTLIWNVIRPVLLEAVS